MPDRPRQLRHSIARFKRLLGEATSPQLAETYRAEIAAAKAMLEEIEQNAARLEKRLDPPEDHQR